MGKKKRKTPPLEAVQPRNRVVELKYLRASELRPHPQNWRRHGAEQRRALRSVLENIGFAGALLVRPCGDGTYEILDGHLRAEAAPDTPLPALVTDLGADEAAALLATYHPLGAMAESDDAQLDALLRTVQTADQDLAAFLEHVAEDAGLIPPDGASEVEPPRLWQVLVDCADEATQREVFEKLRDDGHRCRVLTV